MLRTQKGPRSGPCRSVKYAVEREAQRSGGGSLVLGWVAQHIATSPNRLDIAVLLASCFLELLAQLADEDVDDLQLGLVHATVEMIEEHLLGQCRALAQRKQLQHLVLFA